LARDAIFDFIVFLISVIFTTNLHLNLSNAMVLKELGLAAAVASGLLASAQAQGGLGT